MTPLNSHSANVIALLTMAIFADRRVLSQEVQALIETVLRLQHDGILSSNHSEASLLLWYENNKHEFIGILQKGEFESWLESTLLELAEFPHKTRLFEAILAIARSDNEEHVSEQALAMLVARHWDIADWGLQRLDGSASNDGCVDVFASV